MIRSLIRRFANRLVKNKTTFFTPEHVKNAMQNPDYNKYNELITQINLKRSYYDEMYAKDGTHYLQVGLSALKCVEAAIKQSNCNEVKYVLDMPCGYGRVLRFLQPFFPNAEFSACDLNMHAVDFCKREFGVEGIYSKADLTSLNLGKQFDLIWCGSLATHLSSMQTEALLEFFYRHLYVGGILIFSMHGKKMLANMQSGAFKYALTEKRIEKIVSEVEEIGYGYANYKTTKNYGISAATYSWMKNALEKAGSWRNLYLQETAWDNHHDIYSVVKA